MAGRRQAAAKRYGEQKASGGGKGLTRRELTIGLGAGTATTIMGYFLARDDLPSVRGPRGEGLPRRARPRLGPDVVRGQGGPLTTIRRARASGWAVRLVTSPAGVKTKISPAPARSEAKAKIGGDGSPEA